MTVCEGNLREAFHVSSLSLIDLQRCPSHIAIIMDGNRRWAKLKGLSPMMGHWEGAEALTEVVRAAAGLGVKTLTVYSFSTENWDRPDHEVEALLQIFALYLDRKRDLMVEEGIRLDTIGDISRFPSTIQEALEQTKRATALNQGINLVLAMNYGARDEIRRAVVKIVEESRSRSLSPEDITEQYIASHLDTSPWGDPDLLIRTSGELRLSNFLLWQISYSELYVTDVLWPDFSSENLYQAVLAFQRRSRRLGKGEYK